MQPFEILQIQQTGGEMGGLICFGIIFLPVLIALVWVIGTYNALVRLRNACQESWSGIDTELKRRYDLIPNLVNTVKGYAKHEQETFERVVQARQTAADNQGAVGSQAYDENSLVKEVRHLFALAEAYPELKADEHFLELQKELTRTEDRIQRMRRFYNANVRDINNRIEMFPSSVIANMFGFKMQDFFEVEEAVMREPVKVEL